jgi:murein DD-endopeptidase MepM/ murein hydrolase activator NlpD
VDQESDAVNTNGTAEVELEQPTGEISHVAKPSKRKINSERLIVIGMWLITISVVLLMVYIYLQRKKPVENSPVIEQPAVMASTATPVPQRINLPLPAYEPAQMDLSVTRHAAFHTIIPNRPRQEVGEYTVVAGDSVFGIAKKFNIKPETVLWANYDQLQDNPQELSIGMILNIPPIDGVYYQWQENDTFESVAGEFKASLKEIMNWPGNRFDLINPEVNPGQWVMIPDGQREFQTWFVPQIARDQAGVSKSVYGPGACEGSYEGVYGTGGFIWPTVTRTLSGNDFWSGHLAIDIAASVGDPIFASDSGVIVFSGWAAGGYGNMIMIDHGNGYQTVYAHLNETYVGCGQSVIQGNVIGAAGSTGNSTGPHLHFEVRIWGQFVNPWYVLP